MNPGKPEDYIDIASLPSVRPGKVIDAVRETCRRMYDQQFTARNILEYLATQSPYSKIDQDSLYSTIRVHVRNMALKGEIELVTKGKAGGNGSEPNIYQNKQQ